MASTVVTRSPCHRRVWRSRGKNLMVMMPEQSFPVGKQIPDDQHVEGQHTEHEPMRPDYQFTHFNWNKKCRFANRQPPGPRRAKNQAEAFHERKTAVHKV